MKNTLFICLFAMFALSGCVDDEEEFATGGNISPELIPENKENAVLNTAVFDQLNLDYPGLEKVKQYHEAGEDYLAASALLEYYRTRTNVINPNLSLVDVTYSDADLSKANYALEYRFYVNGQLEDPAIGKPYSVGKAGAINWANNPKGTSAEYQKQLHRHQWFIPQAKVYRGTHDEKYINSWIEVYGDWIVQNPKPEAGPIDEGPWWQLQVAARVLDQVQLLDYYKTSSNFTPEWLTTFLVSFAEQADFLQAYPYKSGGNILITQANALATAGTLMPEFKNAENWKNKGNEILNTEIQQFLADGWHKEFSLHYHIGVIDNFYEAMKLANANGQSVEFKDALRKAVEVVMHFTYPNFFAKGSSSDSEEKLDQIVPMFNDSWNKTRSILTKNFKKYSEMFPESDELKYMATSGNGGASQGNTPGNEMKLFEDAGFYIMRNGWVPESTVMIFSNNKFNDESTSFASYSHNQPDNGTFELWFNGKNLFPDSGSYVYAGEGEVMEQRNWHRQTCVHNTVTLDNKNLDTTESVTKLWQPEGAIQTLVTENPSYKNLKHRRSVFFVDNTYFVIVDEMAGSGKGSINLHYQMPKGEIANSREDMTFLTQFEDGSNMKLQCFGPAGMSMKKEPGWCSTAYRKRYKRMNVSFNVRKDGEEAVRYITVIYPVKKSADAPKFDAKFKNKAFDENGLEVEVKVNGKKQSLKYKL